MNRFILTVITVFSSQLDRLKDIVFHFSRINMDNHTCSCNQAIQNRKGFSKTFGFLLVSLFAVSLANAQTASSTWALTANGNSTNVGNVAGTTIAIGSGISTPAYSAGAGVTTGSWANDAGVLQNDEYYEFRVTPNSNTVFNVTAINFEHSRSNGNWLVQAYYSTDNFVNRTALANAFSSNSSTPAANNNAVNLNVENVTLSVRIYGWESDASNRSLRIRNVVISGTTSCTAGTWTGTTSTDWNTASNWCNGTVPTSSTNVVIPAGTPNMPTISGITAAVNSLTINASATLTLANSAASVLNISGNFTNNGTFTAAGTISAVNFVGTAQTIGGSATTFSNLNINSGTTTMNTGVAISGNLNVAAGVALATTGANTLVVTGTTGVTGTLTLGGAGTKTFTGDVTINSGGAWNETGIAAINFGGSLTNSGTYTATANTTGIHTFSGASKTVSGSGIISVLRIPVMEVTGSYANNGDLYVTTLSGSGAITNALPASTTLVIQGTTTSSIATIINNATAIIENSGAISSTTFTNTGRLELNGSGTIATITNSTGGLVNLNNSGTIASFNNATTTSVLNITDLTVPTITAFTVNTAGNTVNYSGAGAQTVRAGTYSNLILSGSGTKTFGGTTTITSNLSIASGVIANLGTGLTHPAGTLTLGGLTTPSGTWGSTSSTATNTNNTFFAATTGVINVGTATCTAPAAPSSVSNGSRCGVGTVSLSATPGSGQTIDWYAAASGGTALLTGSSSYTTPSIAGTTTYYAEARNTTNYCVSITRTAVTATVNAVPVVTVDKLTSNICSGQSVTLTAAGDPGNAVTMGGSSYMQVSDPNPLGTTTNFTFETMLYWTDNTTNWQRIFDFGSSTANNMFFTPRSDAGNFPRYAITTTGNPGEQRINGNTSITTNTWHHLAITYNSATTTGIMYLDGVQIGINPAMTITPAAITKTFSYFGKSQYGVDPNLEGSMDEIRLWNVARTVTEINTYKASTVPLSSTGLVAYYKLNEGTGTVSSSAIGSSSVALSGSPTRVISTAPVSSSDGLIPTYSWTPTTGLNTSSGNVVIASPTTTTTYTVTSTYPNTCTATANAVVNVSAITTQPSTAGQILCINSAATALTIVASAASGYSVSSYQWFSNTTASASGGTSISGATLASYTPSTATAGTLYYYCVVTISSGCTVTSAVSGAITVNALPTTATVGAAQNRCATLTTTALDGNTPSVGTGTWTQFSGPGTSTFSSVNTGASTATASVVGTYVYRWTISNGSCTSSTADVTVNYYAAPTVSNAGLDISNCNSASFTLAGNTATVGTGAWSVVSGTATISTPSSSTSGVTGITAGNSATLQWTITNGTCTASTDNVVLTNYATPTVSNAGADQSGSNSSFTLAANTPTVGTGAWSIVSGSSTALVQFSNITNPVAVFTPAVTGGSYVLRWTISNGSCTASTDDVVISNCTTNLISNGDFTNSATGNNNAANWTYVGTTSGSYVETYPENTYFATGNTIGFTAELDSQSSIMQTVTVVPGVSYTVSFIYAQRPGAPTPTAVNVKIKDGAATINSPTFSSSVPTPTVGTFDFTPTSSSIGIEFYNSLNGGLTYGTIIDNIVLIPSSQVAPIAVAAGGTFNTATACTGATVQLDVRNVSASGVTYLWTGSPGAVISSATIKNPTITFTGSGMMQATVTVTNAGGCSISSTTYVNVRTPTATAGAALAAICQGAASAAMGGSVGGSATGGTWSGGAGSWTNANNPSTATYTAGTSESGSITLTLTTSGGSCGTTTATKTITVNPTPTLSGASQPTLACDGFGATISLAGLLSNSTSTINYSINGVPQTAVTGVAANGSGDASFTTAVLSTANDGQTLQITGVTTTSAVPNCMAAFTQNVTLSVKSDIGGISLNGIAHASNGTAIYCPSTTATFSITPVPLATSYTWLVPAGWKTEGGVAITAPIITAIPELKVITGSITDYGNVAVFASNVFCPSYLAVTLTNTAPPAPGVSVTALTCSVKGGIAVTLPSAGTTYTLTGTNPVVAAVTNTNGSFSGLDAGDYVVTSQVGAGCVSASASASIQPLVTKTWNGSWSPAGDPTVNDYVIFDADYNLPVSVNSCSCVINPGKNVTIGDLSGSALVLKIINDLNVQGSLTFENNASLVQINDAAVNVGQITYKRTTPLLRDLDYEYWSSPVAGQSLGVFPMSDRYFRYTNVAWEAQTIGTVMEIGRGYIIRVRTSSPFNQEVSFAGVPNNGITSITAQWANKSYLIGNPYPSALDGESFMINNSIVAGSLYFWTHFTARKVNSTGTLLIYNADDYAVFNLLGGTSTAAKSITDAGGTGVTPNGQIASGQAFFVVSDQAGDFTFNNSMRLDGNGVVMDNSQFFKQSNTKKTTKKEKDRVWLNLTNEGGVFKQLLVGYAAGATNDFDKLYDGVTRNGNAYVDFYSVSNSKNYTIQGRSLPFDKADEVPLGYKSTIAGTFNIGIDNVDGGMVNQTIYLEDKLTGSIHDLNSGSYSFATEIGTFNDRFVLRYTNTSKLGTDDAAIKGKGVFVSVTKLQIKINSFDDTLSSVRVYDLKGSLLYNKDKVGKNEFIIDTLNASDQVMIVMMQLEDGTKISEEIIFHD